MCQISYVVDKQTVSESSVVNQCREWIAPGAEDFSTWEYPSRDPDLIEKIKAIKIKPEAFPEVVAPKPKAKSAMMKFIEQSQERFETKTHETKQATARGILKLVKAKDNVKEKLKTLANKGMQKLPHGKDHGDGMPVSLMWDLIHSY